jgi:hypothetical protein
VGAVAGTAAGRLAGAGPWTFVATGIGAAIAVGGYRIASGWRSDEAGFDCAVPEKEPLAGNIDTVVRLLLQGAADTFLWGGTLAVLTAAAHLLLR